MALNLNSEIFTESLFKTKEVEIPTGRGTLETGQISKRIIFTSTANLTWQTAYTVPAGKTLYISDIFFIMDGTSGGTTSDVHEFRKSTEGVMIYNVTSRGSTEQPVTFSHPLVFIANSILEFRATNGATFPNSSIILIGWEQ